MKNYRTQRLPEIELFAFFLVLTIFIKKKTIFFRIAATNQRPAQIQTSSTVMPNIAGTINTKKPFSIKILFPK